MVFNLAAIFSKPKISAVSLQFDMDAVATNIYSPLQSLKHETPFNLGTPLKTKLVRCAKERRGKPRSCQGDGGYSYKKIFRRNCGFDMVMVCDTFRCQRPILTAL
ncbi:hypothetical protein M9H77_16478 [Catharanthus roseus]|uniref:Uncharacterized protein n=1 Tax=Catharanthus roseus TaxID=4058 RepID=A0ACC0B1V8_CATRO|nr:hypothetical protein M9H77_16478 [Catharanthus roseus]